MERKRKLETENSKKARSTLLRYTEGLKTRKNGMEEAEIESREMEKGQAEVRQVEREKHRHCKTSKTNIVGEKEKKKEENIKQKLQKILKKKQQQQLVKRPKCLPQKIKTIKRTSNKLKKKFKRT